MPKPRGVLALTGGTGFIGRHLVQQAVTERRTIRVLARRPPAGMAAPKLTIVPGTLEDEARLAALCAGAETLIHCAGAIRARSTAEFHAVNAAAAERLMGVATQAGVRRIIHISSLAARQPNLSAYADSKRAGERAVEALGDRAAWTVVRPPVIYGPGDHATLPMFRQAGRGVLVRPRGDERRLSLLHVADLVRLVLVLADSRHAGAGRVIEPDDGAGGHSWDAIGAALAAAAGRSEVRPVRISYRTARCVGGIAAAVGLALRRPPLFSGGKAREAFHPDWVARDGAAGLGFWRADTPIGPGFRDTFAWYKEQKWL